MATRRLSVDEPSSVQLDAHLDVRLFGHADVTAGGVPVKFAKRATTLALIALVVLRRGAAISRESLAFTLFPEADESAALADLRRYLYLAGKALPERPGDPWLIVDGETVRWNENSGAFVDVIAFETLGAQPETQAQAIDLYAGDLLADVYDDWVVAERERLRTRYLTILAEMLERRHAARDFPGAIACARRILATDPWREDTLRALMAIRYESGDTAGALAEFETFAKRLRDELAVAPMPETLAVRASILRSGAVPGSLALPPCASPDAAARANAILPFVGRGREFGVLRAAWGRAARGAGSLMLLSGEAGVGKSRLAAELARVAQAEGGRVFAGTTAAPESSPYQALIEALRSALPLVLARPPAPARREALARVLPEIRDPARDLVATPEQPAERETARLYDAFANTVRGLASPRPLLLILEDLHWAGSASIDALGAITRELARTPVLILATCRDEEAPAEHPLRVLQRSLHAHRNVEELALERLREADVVELVERIEVLRPEGDALARDLHAHSEGNALFLNEAISGILEGKDAPLDAVATSVAEIVAARIARLSDDARTAAEIASVAGPGCSVALVRDVSNLPAVSVARGLDELLDRRILREAGARAGYDYAFTHHLIAAAIYADIQPEFRAQRHVRIARILEAHQQHAEGGSPSEIGRHFELGGDGAKAATWYLAAARQAAAVHAYADCEELATKALRQSDAGDVQRAALDMRERARARRGDRAGQRADIEALERLAGDDPRLLFEVRYREVLLARSLGESELEGRAIDALETLAAGLDDAARAKALVQRATHAGERSRQADGIAPARAALAIYERANDVPGQLECLYLLVDFTANLGAIDESSAYLALMHERAGSLADRAAEAGALTVAATAALLRTDYRASAELSARALDLQVALHDRDGEAGSHGRLASTAAWLGDFETALREFQLALDTYESVGNKRGLALTYTNRTMLLMRLGLFPEALESIARSSELFDVALERRTVVANRVNASFVRLQLGDLAEAKALALAALEDARAIEFPIFEAAALANLGNAERALGESAEAIAHMEAGIALRRPIQEPRDFMDDLADLTLAYVAAGRADAAFRTAEELAAIGGESLEGAFWPHYICWAMAQGFAAGNAPERARDAEQRARTALDSFAALIRDDRTRAAFLALPVNLRITGTG